MIPWIFKVSKSNLEIYPSKRITGYLKIYWKGHLKMKRDWISELWEVSFLAFEKHTFQNNVNYTAIVLVHKDEREFIESKEG